MKEEEKRKMFQDVFAPKTGENVLFIIDTPHGAIQDSKSWKERRIMAQEWFTTMKDMGTTKRFSVEMYEYPATGVHNSPLPNETREKIQKSNLVIAMTEYSASSSLLLISRAKDSISRCVSMPLVEKSMEETGLKANYKDVQMYAKALYRMLHHACRAKILFSTGDTLHIDLRNRNPFLEAGECIKTGQFINFPSGEACIAPYEAMADEIKEFGLSTTEGVWPVRYNDELVKFIVKQNRIIDIIGKGKKALEMRNYFKENETRRNIAELGIGCNPTAVVRGNPLEDEKVGLHIAYGMSTHIGGKITSDTHYDIVYAKGCPIEGKTLTIFTRNGTSTDLIKDAQLKYDLLRRKD